jgi:ribosomal protein S3
VEIAGRPKGRARTFMFRLSEGTVAPQTFRFRIGFGFGEAFAKVGLFGITTRIAY